MFRGTNIQKGGMILCVLLLSIAGLTCGDDTEDPNEQQGTGSTVYHVASNGDNTADGQSKDAAFESISHALSLVQPGDTVRIYPGVYHEALQLEDMGNTGDPITIQGESGAVLDGRNQLDAGIWCERCIHFIIEQLEVQNYTDVGVGIYFSADVTLRDLVVHDNGKTAQLTEWDTEGYGIDAEESSQISIENNEVYRNGPSPQLPENLLGNGINTYALSDSSIRRNRCYENVGGGILVEDGVNVLVEGNEVLSNDADASSDGWWAGGLWLDGGHDVTVRANTFRMNKGPGIEVSDEDDQKPYGYILESNQVTENYYGLYVWGFGSSSLPPEHVLSLSDNHIQGNPRQDIWIEP